MTLDLFTDASSGRPPIEALAAGAVILRGFALEDEATLLSVFHDVARVAPFRHMITPGGFRMSVAMTNCGALGWVTDSSGYRYAAIDPERNRPWPAMPAEFRALARRAAAAAGYAAFEPDSCLINRYEPGSRLTLHQDKNERDYRQPIVSVSLGLPATFQFGGSRRADRTRRVPLAHGDVVVWGGESRLNYHGVAPLKDGEHPLLGRVRINLTFRKAG